MNNMNCRHERHGNGLPEEMANVTLSGITTETLANSIGYKPSSIRVRLCETGSFFGVKPHKLPSGRLLWPNDAVQQLIERGAQ